VVADQQVAPKGFQQGLLVLLGQLRDRFGMGRLERLARGRPQQVSVLAQGWIFTHRRDAPRVMPLTESEPAHD
jgi:hypothetical protein